MESDLLSTTSDEDHFGTRLRYERQRRGWTQAQVAQKLASQEGITLHPSAVAKMETRGVDRPRVITLNEAAALSRIFGVRLEDLLRPVDSGEQLRQAEQQVSQARSRVDDAEADLEVAQKRLDSLRVDLDIA